MFGLDLGLSSLLLFCIIAALAFEFINGFHDTANAVATVIYTNSLKPRVAVVWSGLMNFIGVNVGGIAVAIGIINLLPTEALIDQNTYHSISMIMALVFTAIIWNLGTWYFGIPCSSSHTLLGSIFGVGIAYMLLPGSHAIALNWKKVNDVGLSLLVSPIFGFGLAYLLMQVLKKNIKNKTIFEEPEPQKVPPFWIRSILFITCTLVSFFHGSNDGQKGVGLMMIILIGIVPSYFALDHSKKPEALLLNVKEIHATMSKIESKSLGEKDAKEISKSIAKLDSIETYIVDKPNFESVKGTKHFEIRKDILTIAKFTTKLLEAHKNKLPNLSEAETTKLQKNISAIKSYTEYAPMWVILAIALSIGFGTMVGWKRIVVTIGEKIGKSHLTYAQGATAELIGASTIAASTWLGLPVSTTHVLSSGIAGTMVASNGVKNLQMKTVKNILLAWLVTLPITIILSGTLFLILRLIFV